MRGKVIIGLFAICILRLSSSVNTGRKASISEIAFGRIVDYERIRGSFPFMARLNMDGAHCGGAMISDRYKSWVIFFLFFCLILR